MEFYLMEEKKMEDPVYFGKVKCTDGEVIRRIYAFNERTYEAECRRQNEIEGELISEAYEKHGGCEFYSVDVCERELAESWL